MREAYLVQRHHYHNVLDSLGNTWARAKRWGLGRPADLGELTYHRLTVDELAWAYGAMFHAHCGYRDMRGA